MVGVKMKRSRIVREPNVEISVPIGVLKIISTDSLAGGPHAKNNIKEIPFGDAATGPGSTSAEWFWSAWLFFIALLALSVGALSSARVLDDEIFLTAFNENPWAAALGAFHFDKFTFWRPLGTWTMLAPLWAKESFGGPSGAIVASKAISILLFALVGSMALKHVSSAGAGRKRSNSMPLFLVAGVLGLSPVFAEPIMWMSARFDLLLMLFLMALMLRQNEPKPYLSHKRVFIEAFLIGACLAMSKEAGLIWSVGLGWGFMLSRGQWHWGAGLLSSSLACFVARKIMIPLYEASSVAMGKAVWVSRDAVWNLEYSAPRALESLGREFLLIACPMFDTNPLHPQGWGGFGIQAFGALMAALCVLAWAMLALRAKKREASSDEVWFCVALGLLCLHAIVGSFIFWSGVKQSPWLISSRFVAPSALVLAVLAGRQALQGKLVGHLCAWALGAALAGSITVGVEAKQEWKETTSLLSKTMNGVGGAPTTWSVSAWVKALSDQGDGEQAYTRALLWVKSGSDMEVMCFLWDFIDQSKNSSRFDLDLVARKRKLMPYCGYGPS